MLSVVQGKSAVLNVYFYEYSGGPLYDPTDDDISPSLEIFDDDALAFGPFSYSNGTGEIIRQSIGHFYYVFETNTNTDFGIWTAYWSIEDETQAENFEVLEAASESNFVVRAFIVDEQAG